MHFLKIIHDFMQKIDIYMEHKNHFINSDIYRKLSLLIRTLEHKITLCTNKQTQAILFKHTWCSSPLNKFRVLFNYSILMYCNNEAFFILEGFPYSTNSSEGKVRKSKWMNCVTRVLKHINKNKFSSKMF